MRHAGWILLLVAGLAQAHTRGTSYSDWQLDADGAQVRARVSQLDLTRLQLDVAARPSDLDEAARLLTRALQLRTPTGACRAGLASAQVTLDGWVEARWRVECVAGGGERAIRSELLREVAPSHLHFVHVLDASGASQERVLTYAEPVMLLAGPPPAHRTLLQFTGLGVEHILSGWDHLAFVLGLLLLAASLRELALVISAFTLAHSVTLAAAVLGYARVQAPAVEAVIGFSVLLVAAEGLWRGGGAGRTEPALLACALAVLALAGGTVLSPWLLGGLAVLTACFFALARDTAQPLRLHAAVAFGFGLVHGFGFASALSPLDLPPGRTALALGGFNLGVELGQLGVVLLAWPLLGLTARSPTADRWAREGLAATIAGLGTYWFVARAF